MPEGSLEITSPPRGSNDVNLDSFDILYNNYFLAVVT